MSFEYKKDYGFNCTQLRIRDKVDEDATKEILKGNYQSLWLYCAIFNRAQDIVDQGLTLKYLRVTSNTLQDVSWINKLQKIEYLLLRGRIRGCIEFANLINLKNIDVEFNRTTKKIIDAGLVAKTVLLSKFNKQLSCFDSNSASHIKTLGLTAGNLKNLDGIEMFNNLEVLTLMNLRKLVNIESILKCKNLKILEIYACNNIKNIQVIQFLLNLKIIVYENKELPSLKILPKNKMTKVRLGPMVKILDGNVEEFLNFPKLEKVTFTKKREYKYSAHEINTRLGFVPNDF